MSTRTSIGDLHLGSVRDLCPVKDGDPPFSFTRDLKTSEPPLPSTYKSPHIDNNFTYWGPK